MYLYQIFHFWWCPFEIQMNKFVAIKSKETCDRKMVVDFTTKQKRVVNEMFPEGSIYL